MEARWRLDIFHAVLPRSHTRSGFPVEIRKVHRYVQNLLKVVPSVPQDKFWWPDRATGQSRNPSLDFWGKGSFPLHTLWILKANCLKI